MTRILVTETRDYDYDDTPDSGYGSVVGWFDLDRATRIDSGTRWDGHNHISCATGSQWIDEWLIRTASGRWVLNHDASRYHSGLDEYHYITEDEARAWMIRAQVADSIIEAHFSPVEEEAEIVHGRPAVGPQVVVRMPVELRDRVDTAAAAAGMTRAQWVRRAVESALDES